MASLKADGSPLTVATWYLFEDGRILVNLDDGRKRLQHLKNDPRVSLTVLDSNWYRHVSLQGRVTELSADTDLKDIDRNGPVVASFPATQAEQLMLVTDQAKLIRLPLASLRVIGRGSAGVRLFNVADNEHVVSAVRLDSTLSAAFAPFRVNNTATNDQERPVVSLLKNGGAAFAWQGGRQGFQHIYARFL